jgi:hypothetical protein
VGKGQPVSRPEYRVPAWWRSYHAQFPDWRVWKGENGLLYARLPRTDPLVVVHGQDADELREEIARAVVS